MKNKNENFKYSFALSFTVLLLASIVLAFLTYYIREKELIWDVASLWLENPISFVLNVIPILCFGLVILAVSSRLDISLIISSIVVLLLAYINDQKIIYREEPLVLADIFNIKEAINMVSGFGFGISLDLFKKILVIILILFIVYKLTSKFRIKLPDRIATFTLAVGIFTILLLTLYSSEKIYESFPRTVEVETNIAQSYKDKGFIYAALYHRDSHRIKKPTAYDEKYRKDLLNEFTYQENSFKPHVVMVMGEAWTDLSKYFEFEEGQDPYVNASQAIDESLYRGHMVVPAFGGGTANTEYDALTGSSTIRHSEGIFISYSTIRGPRTSIASIFSDYGYKTLAIHPGDSWFYNRDNVFSYLGFDQSFFEEDMVEPVYKGGFPSERDLTSYIIEKFENNYSDGPLFEFAITIQNHSPYNIDKYGYVDSTIINTNDLDKETLEAYETYFMGIRDMDQQIKELKDYFNSIDEPVVFIYFGDHLPYINANYQAFYDIGMDIDVDRFDKIQDIYKTPFFVWGNDSYMDETDLNEEDLYISANFLAPLVLKTAQLENVHPYYQYLDTLMDVMPVIFKYFYIVQEDGGYVVKKYDQLDREELYHLGKFDTLNYIMSKESDIEIEG